MNNNGIIFKIFGRFAHFKKFYTNKSSLTYNIPPRTVIMGIIASILEEQRDSYYDWLSPKHSKIGIRIIKQGYTHFECMNYLSAKGGHTQVRLELLKSVEGNIEYEIYFITEDSEKLKELRKRIKNKNFGYGVYLGQRQFRAYVEYIGDFVIQSIETNTEGGLNTLTYKDNVIGLNDDSNIKIIRDRLPISFSENIVIKKKEKVRDGRIPEKYSDVVYEETGKYLNGKFKEIIKIELSKKDMLDISFFTSLN